MKITFLIILLCYILGTTLQSNINCKEEHVLENDIDCLALLICGFRNQTFLVPDSFKPLFEATKNYYLSLADNTTDVKIDRLLYRFVVDSYVKYNRKCAELDINETAYGGYVFFFRA